MRLKFPFIFSPDLDFRVPEGKSQFSFSCDLTTPMHRPPLLSGAPLITDSEIRISGRGISFGGGSRKRWWVSAEGDVGRELTEGVSVTAVGAGPHPTGSSGRLECWPTRGLRDLGYLSTSSGALNSLVSGLLLCRGRLETELQAPAVGGWCCGEATAVTAGCPPGPTANTSVVGEFRVDLAMGRGWRAATIRKAFPASSSNFPSYNFPILF